MADSYGPQNRGGGKYKKSKEAKKTARAIADKYKKQGRFARELDSDAASSKSRARHGNISQKLRGAFSIDEEKRSIRIGGLVIRTDFLLRRVLPAAIVVAGIIAVICIIVAIGGMLSRSRSSYDLPEYVKEDYIDTNSNSRPGISLYGVDAIVIHASQQEGCTAEEMRDYYNDLSSTSPDTYGGAHFIIDTDGSVLACVPQDEVTYNNGPTGLNTLSIEYCVSDGTDDISIAAYNSLADLCAWLCEEYGLGTSGIIRHSDIEDVTCPAYFTTSQEEFDRLKTDIQTIMDNNAGKESESETAQSSQDGQEESSQDETSQSSEDAGTQESDSGTDG